MPVPTPLRHLAVLASLVILAATGPDVGAQTATDHRVRIGFEIGTGHVALSAHGTNIYQDGRLIELLDASGQWTYAVALTASAAVAPSGFASDVRVRTGLRFTEIGGANEYVENAFVGIYYDRRFVQRYLTLPFEVQYMIAGSDFFVGAGAEYGLLLDADDTVSYLVGPSDDRRLEGARKHNATATGSLGLELDAGVSTIRVAYVMRYGLLSDITAAGDGYTREHGLTVGIGL